MNDPKPLTPSEAVVLVFDGATIRVHAAGFGCQDTVMAEGKVIAFSPAPTLTIEHADGTRSSWQITLPIAVVEDVDE